MLALKILFLCALAFFFHSSASKALELEVEGNLGELGEHYAPIGKMDFVLKLKNQTSSGESEQDLGVCPPWCSAPSVMALVTQPLH